MREPTSFSVGQHQYRARRMDVRMQLNVSRRVTPLLVGMIEPMIEQMKLASKRREAILQATGGAGATPAPIGILDMDIKSLLPGLARSAELLAGMSDTDFDYLQDACLSLVERQRSGDTGWVSIWNSRAKMSQFEDIEGHEILLIMTEVLKAEIGPFLVGIVSSMSDGGPL